MIKRGPKDIPTGIPFWASERRISPPEGTPSKKNSPDPKSLIVYLQCFYLMFIIIYVRIRRTSRTFARTSNTKWNPCISLFTFSRNHAYIFFVPRNHANKKGLTKEEFHSSSTYANFTQLCFFFHAIAQNLGNHSTLKRGDTNPWVITYG